MPVTPTGVWRLPSYRHHYLLQSCTLQNYVLANYMQYHLLHLPTMSLSSVSPSLSTILINVYRNSTELFVDGLTLRSEEGTTQGDPLAMPMYALATIPLINRLRDETNVVQVWYADDASASGSLSSLRKWWDSLASAGPAYGYHANAGKTWLITKDTFFQSK